MKGRNAAYLLALAIGLASLGAASDLRSDAQPVDLVMVANKSNDALAKMNQSMARKLLLGETTTWPNGGTVTVVLEAPGSADRSAILQKICKMSEAEYVRHNLQSTFMGESIASVHQAHSAETVKSFVKANPGAVGFLHKSDVDDSIQDVWPLN